VLALLAILLAALVLPAAAQAKVTCEEPRRAGRDVPLRGLPAAPEVDRVYRLTATLQDGEGVNPAPHLAAEYCGGGAAHEATAGAGGWFSARGNGRYVLDLRFTHPGPWAVSFMDRDGVFHDLGIRRVGPTERLAPEQALGDGVVNQGAELRGEAGPRLADHDVPGLGSLALEQALWIFEPGAVLEQQAHLALAGVDGAHVAGFGVTEADPVPARVDALGQIGLGGQHRVADP
jgi:hypothetical protein